MNRLPLLPLIIVCLLFVCVTVVAQQPQQPDVRVEPADAAFLRGLAEKERGNHRAAAEAFKQATELKPDSPGAFYELALAYQNIGEHKKALAAMKEANRLKPDDLDFLLELGYVLRANQKFGDAIAPLKRVAAARPNEVEILYLLGNTQLMAGKHEDAIKTLNQVLVLDPSHSEARERLRVSSVRNNLWPQMQRMQQEVAERPDSSEARADLGQTYNALGLHSEAEQEYLKAVALDPKNADARIRLCVNYSEWGKLEQWIECYQEAIKLKQHHVLFMSLGDLYQRQGKFEEAAVAYQKSLELKPTFTFSLYGLGYVLIKQGRYEEAIGPLRRLLEVEPKDVYGNHALGIAYAKTGNKTGAMQQYYILQNLNPRVAEELLPLIPQ
jgi:tetratricopeptide (TPR) repeat protein